MNIHEYQAKQIFRQYGVPVLPGAMASSMSAATEAAAAIDGDHWVVKAQIHAGGRSVGHFENASDGAGGVREAGSVDEVGEVARAMIDHVLVTPQTGPGGREVKHVYIEQHCGNVERELYLAMLVDRQSSRLTLLASNKGGVDIETVGQRSPESIFRLPIDLKHGPADTELNQLITALGLSGAPADQFGEIVRTMSRLYVEVDASLIEINPLAITDDGKLIALDATMTLDDNALFRHPDNRALRDQDELMVGELEAASHGLNYIKLGGNIGCMASGAGLSLATIDAVKLIGGEPANFLDIPPVAEVGRVRQALNLVLSDPGVRSVLINVFGGGIMRCDTIADAIIMTNRESAIGLPLIVRLAGTNADFAVRRLRDMGPQITFAQDLADAAEKATAAALVADKVERRSWWDRVMGSADKN